MSPQTQSGHGESGSLGPQLAIDGPSNGGPIASPPFPDQRPVLAEHRILRRRRHSGDTPERLDVVDRAGPLLVALRGVVGVGADDQEIAARLQPLVADPGWQDNNVARLAGLRAPARDAELTADADAH